MPTGPRYFYPRSPCGERPLPNKIDKDTAGISIHALLAESDAIIYQAVPVGIISIHALLAESDKLCEHMSKTDGISIHALLAESDIGCKMN